MCCFHGQHDAYDGLGGTTQPHSSQCIGLLAYRHSIVQFNPRRARCLCLPPSPAPHLPQSLLADGPSAGTMSLNTTILHFGSPGRGISGCITWRACSCWSNSFFIRGRWQIRSMRIDWRRNGLPVQQVGIGAHAATRSPYAGGGLGTSSTSLSQSTAVTPGSAVAVGWASRLSGRTSSAGMWI